MASVLFNIFDIGRSGMSANSQRLNVVASNMVNNDSPNYKPKQVVFKQTRNGGVKVAQIVEDTGQPKLIYDPKHPMADANGYVAMPNNNPVENWVDMLSASHSYLDAVELFNTDKQMCKETFTIAQS